MNLYYQFHPLDYLTPWSKAGGWVFDHRKRKLVAMDFLKNKEVVHEQIGGSNLKRCASL
jgi:hypothetical protein